MTHKKNNLTETPDWAAERAHYEAVTRMTYLNTAGGGSLSRELCQLAEDWLRVNARLGVAAIPKWLVEVEKARTSVATFIGASEPDDVGFFSNASTALSNVPLIYRQNSGEVLLLEGDHPAIQLSWMEQDFPINWIPQNSTGGITVDEIRRAITPQTSFLALSHVQYTSGYRADLTGIGSLCREHGITLVVDATQSLGACDINVERDNVDVLVASGYKWLGGIYGIAVGYFSPKEIAGKRLSAVGLKSVASWEKKNERPLIATTAKALEAGHPPIDKAICLGASVRKLGTLGIEHIEARIEELSTHLISSLQAAGFSLVSQIPKENQSGIVNISVSDPGGTVARLAQQGIIVSDRSGALRVSLHFYNNKADIDRLIKHLSELH